MRDRKDGRRRVCCFRGCPRDLPFGQNATAVYGPLHTRVGSGVRIKNTRRRGAKRQRTPCDGEVVHKKKESDTSLPPPTEQPPPQRPQQEQVDQLAERPARAAPQADRPAPARAAAAAAVWWGKVMMCPTPFEAFWWTKTRTHPGKTSLPSCRQRICPDAQGGLAGSMDGLESTASGLPMS